MNRVFTVTQARSIYLRRLAESKRTGSADEQLQAHKDVKKAQRLLQQAQLTHRLRRAKNARVPRPHDWNAETW